MLFSCSLLLSYSGFKEEKHQLHIYTRNQVALEGELRAGNFNNLNKPPVKHKSIA